MDFFFIDLAISVCIVFAVILFREMRDVDKDNN